MNNLVLLGIANFLANIAVINAFPYKEPNKYVVSNQRVSFYEAYLRCRQYGLDPAEIISQRDHKDVEEALELEREYKQKYVSAKARIGGGVEAGDILKMQPEYMFFASFFAVIVAGVCSYDGPNKYVVSTQRVSFYEGYLRCRQYGLDPGEIVSLKDQRDVEEKLQTVRELGWEQGFWIFATNLGNKVSYYWLNSGRPIFYSLFAPGQPDNAGNKENCLEVFQTTTGHFAWNDAPCDHKLRFICQYKQKPSDSCDDNRVAGL
ncbi:collectin-10-like [Rhynchophorus ferrugineus]|uniref:collectin-10-like n=1 Tax=Rhynchophorus ferrugineus TaxID=354439 RepID=UPI003FCE9DEC